MNVEIKKNWMQSITRQIIASKQNITVMFTDIEGSTRYWETKGDVRGRLMVDMHNRLIFPVIKKFRGKIIKTIGDAIMASFKKPSNAIKAAVAIQQILEKMRQNDPAFEVRVRIGIHTGKAIVEHNDIYGDVVNVASRVESHGKGNEILVSGSTAAKLNPKAYCLTRHGSFVPKGKKKPIILYECKWPAAKNLIRDISTDRFLPLIFRQKLMLLFYGIVSVGFFYFLFNEYLRYMIADQEFFALNILNPMKSVWDYPLVPALVIVAGIESFLLLFRLKTLPVFFLKVFKGGFYATLFFLSVHLAASFLPIDFDEYRKAPLWRSKHLFVTVTADSADIRKYPSFKSPVISSIDKNSILLLTDVKKRKNTTWNKVLIDKNKYGWVVRKLPERMGSPEMRLTIADKFYFRFCDAAAVAAGLIGFFIGYIKFNIHPV